MFITLDVFNVDQPITVRFDPDAGEGGGTAFIKLGRGGTIGVGVAEIPQRLGELEEVVAELRRIVDQAVATPHEPVEAVVG